MNKTVWILSFIIAFLLLTNTALERSLSRGVWSLSKGVVGETQYVVEDVGSGLLTGVDSARVSIAKTIVHYQKLFKSDIDNNTQNKSVLTYIFYFVLLFLGIFFIYKLLFYILLFIFLYWLYIVIRNRF